MRGTFAGARSPLLSPHNLMKGSVDSYLDRVHVLGLKFMQEQENELLSLVKSIGENELLSLVKSIRKSYYSDYMSLMNSVNIPSLMTYNSAKYTEHGLSVIFGKDFLDNLFKRAHADSNIVSRLRSRIELMLNLGDCIFLTFTFTDNSLAKYNTDYLRLCVKRYLNLYSALYIANVDYGKENGRIHFHAVALTGHVNFKAWKFGALNAERIHSVEDSLCLARYVSKLVNHALKESTRRQSIIYSRGFVDIEKNLKNFQNDIDN